MMILQYNVLEIQGRKLYTCKLNKDVWLFITLTSIKAVPEFISLLRFNLVQNIFCIFTYFRCTLIINHWTKENPDNPDLGFQPQNRCSNLKEKKKDKNNLIKMETLDSMKTLVQRCLD